MPPWINVSTPFKLWRRLSSEPEDQRSRESSNLNLSLSRQAGIDPKLVADQLGHGLGVNLDVYTVAALDKRQDAVEVLESALVRRGPA